MAELRTIDRREFLRRTGVVGGGLVLGMSLSRLAGLDDALADSPTAFEPNVFVSVDTDGTVTLVVSRSEMGQGTRTGMPMLLAEELCVGLDQVRLVQADGDEKYGHQLTGGSLSVRLMWDPLRGAGAAARTMLVGAAAERWSVSASECEAERAVVHHRASGRSATYAELAEAASRQPVPDKETVEFRSHDEFRLIGTAQPRLDAPDIVTGRARYGMDTRLPGLRYAAITRCPVYGGSVSTFDAGAALGAPGVRDVIELRAPEAWPDLAPGVAVVADDTWSALRGVGALRVSWNEGENAGVSTQHLLDRFSELSSSPGEVVRDDGDADAALAGADQVLEASYDLPFLAHAPMEPPNCTVHVRDGACEVWTPTQNPQEVRTRVGRALGLPVERVDVHVTLVGGGFGRRLYPDAEVEAALLARELEGPVMVVWTREDDLAHDLYRPSSRHVLRGGLDARGNLVAWHWHILNTAGGRFDPQDFPAHHVPNYHVEYTRVPWILPRGAWRSTVNSQNPFVSQCFFDELAAAAGRDPLEWRLRMLRERPRPDGGNASFENERMVRVVEEVASRADWGSTLPTGHGRGVSFFFGYGSYAAEVAEVRVSGSEIRVQRVVCVLDCGEVINPDLVQAQIEGAIAFGLSAAMKQAITVRGGRVRERNFDDFPTLLGSEMPRIEGHVVESHARPGGVGETPLPPAAPAVANAVFAASGHRARSLPLSVPA